MKQIKQDNESKSEKRYHFITASKKDVTNDRVKLNINFFKLYIFSHSFSDRFFDALNNYYSIFNFSLFIYLEKFILLDKTNYNICRYN